MSCSEVMTHGKGHVLLLCHCVLIDGALRSMTSTLKVAEFPLSAELQCGWRRFQAPSRGCTAASAIVTSGDQIHRRAKILKDGILLKMKGQLTHITL